MPDSLKLGEGCPEEWSQLVDTYYARLLLYCGRFVSDPGDARDLVHEAFIKARRNIEKYDPKYAMSTWLYSIARNTGLDHVRKRKRAAELGMIRPSSSAAGTIICRLPDQNRGPRTACGDGSVHRVVFTAMDDLSDEHAEVLMLRYIDDLSRKEIAELLNIPENTVKSRLVSGLKKLRKLLPQELYDK